MADNAIRLELRAPRQLRDELNDAGRMGGTVEAACVARQGHSPTMAGAILLYGLVKLLLPGSRQLPRTFVIAATADRVAAFPARGMVVDRDIYKVTLNVGEVGAWPRSEVAAEPAPAGITANALLSLPADGSPEEIRISAPNSKVVTDFEETVQALRR